MPHISPEEIREVLEELHKKGIEVPEPQSVTLRAGEDYQGDPAFFLKVTFAKRHKPEDIPWRTISPLVRALGRLVFTKGGESRPVIPEVRRLSEKLPKA